MFFFIINFSECRVSDVLPDLTPCSKGNFSGFCANGKCTSRNAQCAEINNSFFDCPYTLNQCLTFCSQDSVTCENLNHQFRDGTNCAWNGKCFKGKCLASIHEFALGFLFSYRQYSIAVGSVMFLIACYYAHVLLKRRKRKKLHDQEILALEIQNAEMVNNGITRENLLIDQAIANSLNEANDNDEYQDYLLGLAIQMPENSFRENQSKFDIFSQSKMSRSNNQKIPIDEISEVQDNFLGGHVVRRARKSLNIDIDLGRISKGVLSADITSASEKRKYFNEKTDSEQQQPLTPKDNFGKSMTRSMLNKMKDNNWAKNN